MDEYHQESLPFPFWISDMLFWVLSLITFCNLILYFAFILLEHYRYKSLERDLVKYYIMKYEYLQDTKI